MALFIDFEVSDNHYNLEASISDVYYKKVLDFILLLSNKDNPFTVKTSGSTGVPNEIHFTMNQAFESAKLSNAFFNLDNRSILLLPMNIDFVGAKMLLVRAFVAKAKVWIVSPSALVFEDVPENIFFDLIALTPYQLKLTMDSSPKRFQQVKKCLVGGSSISIQLLNKIKSLSSECQFFESFGMSETLSHFAIKQLDTQNDFYRVIEGYHIQVSSEGQLSIQCPFLDNTVVSNDIVEMIDAKHFRFLGRKDFIVNSAGIKIHPELLEASLQDSFSFPFYFSKENDEIFGEILVLNILKENELSDIEILELYKLQIKNKFLLPKKIKRLQAFEYTQNGKIRKI